MTPGELIDMAAARAWHLQESDRRRRPVPSAPMSDEERTMKAAALHAKIQSARG